MTNKKVLKIAASLVVSSVVTFGLVAPVFAQNSSTTNTSSTTVVKRTKSESTLVNNADKEISKRVTDINNLLAKIGDMKNMSDADKANLSGSLQDEISSLNSLQAKIAGDTDLTTLKADIKSITADNRIYALFIPKNRILATSDRATTILNMFTAMGTKLQARIDAVQATGKDVTTLQSALTDFNAKLSEAKSLVASNMSGIQSLSPDQGNKTVASTNSAAIDVARKNLKVINSDFSAARKDITTIMKGIKGIGGSDNATNSTSSAATTTNQ